MFESTEKRFDELFTSGTEVGAQAGIDALTHPLFKNQKIKRMNQKAQH